ncbi:hypothetical protein RFI_22035, partial [Reticulomyxa filosa]
QITNREDPDNVEQRHENSINKWYFLINTYDRRTVTFVKTIMTFEIQVGDGQYLLGGKVGNGSFGIIHEGKHMTSGETVAIKLEKADTRCPQLQYEYKIYKHLKGTLGVPSVKWYGREGDFNVLIMQMVFFFVFFLAQKKNKKNLKKIFFFFFEKKLERIEQVHSHQFIHRDIKPDNFLIGLHEHFNTVFVIDFGLAKRYIIPKTKEHIPFVKGKSLIGTARYASVSTHLGYEQARRDDLETIGYVLLYFAKQGKLPWQGLKKYPQIYEYIHTQKKKKMAKAKTKEAKYDRIATVKQKTTIEQLCEGLPEEFAAYLKYCRELEFDHCPNYQYLRGLFRMLFQKNQFVDDGQFDWTIKTLKAVCFAVLLVFIRNVQIENLQVSMYPQHLQATPMQNVYTANNVIYSFHPSVVQSTNHGLFYSPLPKGVGIGSYPSGFAVGVNVNGYATQGIPMPSSSSSSSAARKRAFAMTHGATANATGATAAIAGMPALSTAMPGAQPSRVIYSTQGNDDYGGMAGREEGRGGEGGRGGRRRRGGCDGGEGQGQGQGYPIRVSQGPAIPIGMQQVPVLYHCPIYGHSPIHHGRNKNDDDEEDEDEEDDEQGDDDDINNNSNNNNQRGRRREEELENIPEDRENNFGQSRRAAKPPKKSHHVKKRVENGTKKKGRLL